MVKVLEVLKTSWSMSLDVKMLWAIVTLAFFRFMRSGELELN